MRRWLVIVIVVAFLGGGGLSTYLLVVKRSDHVAVAKTPVSQWAHPKANAWVLQNETDVKKVLADSQSIYGDMKCDPTVDSCMPGEPLTPNPNNWTEIIFSDCAPLLADLGTARSDGPIPDGQVERWWSTALVDAQSACQAVEAANGAIRSAEANGVTGYNPEVQGPGAEAMADITATGTLLQRVGDYVTARR